MSVRIDVPVYAPIPVGHRVSVLYLKYRGIQLFGGESRWEPAKQVVVCDESTRIVYADRSIQLHPESTYEQLAFETERMRFSQVRPPLRGTVTSCVVLTDSGDSVYLHTLLGIEEVALR
jgi:hypothetical protein